MNKETILLPNQTECFLYQTDRSKEKNVVAIYFHGGGLIYGSKNDLPKSLLHVFLEKGISLVSIDYLLAPNSSVENIIEDAFQTVNYIMTDLFPDKKFQFIGRSAGSFIMFQVVNRLILTNSQLPIQLVNFYGYDRLDYLETQTEPFQFQKFPTINFSTPIKDDPLFERFLCYKEALDHRSLKSLLGLSDQFNDFTIPDSTFEKFPPTFHTSSSSDKEVPFAISKQLSKKIPNSQFAPVYYLDHDFLKESPRCKMKCNRKDMFV
ncbi:alpha/beta hydrolase [Streptococcus pluranimalium]|uniref:alpha/beta hydrolase n=1 Tax=Streptococcus pluranimalium TaxID=82348 RepID=UPI003F68C303